MFVRHNQQFFREADMKIAPMVLDQDQPSPDVKDAFQQFSPDGFATIVEDHHGRGGRLPDRQIWKGMPILELLNDTCNTKDSGQIAAIMANAIKSRGNVVPGILLFPHRLDQPCHRQRWPGRVASPTPRAEFRGAVTVCILWAVQRIPGAARQISPSMKMRSYRFLFSADGGLRRQSRLGHFHDPDDFRGEIRSALEAEAIASSAVSLGVDKRPRRKRPH